MYQDLITKDYYQVYIQNQVCGLVWQKKYGRSGREDDTPYPTLRKY